MTGRIEAALERARADASAPTSGPPDGVVRKRRLAIGDPQAPIEKLLAILDHHQALGDGGRLRPEVLLVSMGDQFDYGPPEQRPQATQSGLWLLSWLAAHPSDQVVLLAGNHDLARVCELSDFDASSYEAARAHADLAYRRGRVDKDEEQRFLACYPALPTAELIARDYSDFCIAQRELVSFLLRAGRLKLAYAPHPKLLFVHAGVTTDDLGLAGLTGPNQRDALAAASALQANLESAVARWNRGPLNLEPLHRPGSASAGEGRGILYQRPAHPSRGERAQFAGPPRRRFDPRTLPLGLTQAVGHIRDGKCRELLGDWARPEPELDGPLRRLVTDGESVEYARKGGELPAGAGALLFLDGGMNHAALEQYELLDFT